MIYVNPPIPTMPCFKCGVLTNAIQCVYGVSCKLCYNKENK
jgi:hypothetical protein